ncbi:MAG: flavoprotein, partial [Oscillospiraceae bacterium]
MSDFIEEKCEILKSPVKLGFAICGSFCTFKKNIEIMEQLHNMGYDIVPIMSFNAYNIDTRFGKAKEHIEKIEKICGKKIINTIEAAEPIGPKAMTDIMLVSPCTGNTLAKLSMSITDTPVTLAVKSHLRN